MRLLGGQRGPAGGHRRRRLTLEHLREVEVSLDQHRKAARSDGSLGQVQPVQRPALRIDGRFGRIQVFRNLLGIHRPPAEGDDRPGLAADGYHQTVAEPVDDLAAVALHQQAALQQQRLREPLLEEDEFESVPRRRRESESQLLGGLRVDAAILQLLARPGAGGSRQLLAEVRRCDLVGLQQRFAQLRVATAVL